MKKPKKTDTKRVELNKMQDFIDSLPPKEDILNLLDNIITDLIAHDLFKQPLNLKNSIQQEKIEMLYKFWMSRKNTLIGDIKETIKEIIYDTVEMANLLGNNDNIVLVDNEDDLKEILDEELNIKMRRMNNE